MQGGETEAQGYHPSQEAPSEGSVSSQLLTSPLGKTHLPEGSERVSGGQWTPSPTGPVCALIRRTAGFVPW